MHNTAMWMSEDSHMLLYASFNDSLVQELRFPWYGIAEDEQQLYPDMRGLRYPKVSRRPYLHLHTKYEQWKIQSIRSNFSFLYNYILHKSLRRNLHSY